MLNTVTYNHKQSHPIVEIIRNIVFFRVQVCFCFVVPKILRQSGLSKPLTNVVLSMNLMAFMNILHVCSFSLQVNSHEFSLNLFSRGVKHRAEKGVQRGLSSMRTYTI